MKPGLLARLALASDLVASRLLFLRALFPRQNVSLMVSRHPRLLTSAEEEIRAGVEAAAATLQGLTREVMKTLFFFGSFSSLVLIST
jgi:hypothetical protein